MNPEIKKMNGLTGKIKCLLWPQVCPLCGRVQRDRVCPKCAKAIRRLTVKEPRCMKCGKPLQTQEEEYCGDCSHTYHHYDRGLSLWLHKPPVSTSIYRFKYHNLRVYGEFYAGKLVKHYRHQIEKWAPDMIVPVPLHPARKKKRGYNQAEILAEQIGELTGILVEKEALLRCRSTNPQKELGSKERRYNLKRAFRVKKTFTPVDTVLLIDDIYTTGSTLDAAALVLKNAGVGKVYFLTISIGQGY